MSRIVILKNLVNALTMGDSASFDRHAKEYIVTRSATILSEFQDTKRMNDLISNGTGGGQLPPIPPKRRGGGDGDGDGDDEGSKYSGFTKQQIMSMPIKGNYADDYAIFKRVHWFILDAAMMNEWTDSADLLEWIETRVMGAESSMRHKFENDMEYVEAYLRDTK